MTDHERWSGSAAAYLLGAMEDHEATTFESHLADCPLCREEVDSLAPAARALPSAVDPVAPPPALKARIMAEVEREAALLAAAGPEADRPARAPARPRERRRRTWLGLPRWAPVAIAAVLLVGVAVGIGVGQLGGSGQRTVQAQVLDKSRAPHASVKIEVGSDGATLVAHGLPAPPSGRVYQVWLKRGGHAPQPTSALFTPRSDGTATATVPGDLSGIDQMLVTDEPPGGSRRPTTSPLLAAALS
jgi:anti-sigma-K factor RskA